jgi:hypothetical protein
MSRRVRRALALVQAGGLTQPAEERPSPQVRCGPAGLTIAPNGNPWFAVVCSAIAPFQLR